MWLHAVSAFAIVFIFMLFAPWVRAGTASDGFFSPDREPLFVKVFVALPDLSLSIDGEGINQTWFDPNTVLSLGLAASWRGYGGRLSVRAGGAEDSDLYGTTRYYDAQVRWYRERLAADAFLQSYRGYHIRDLPEDCRRGDPCSLRPDLQIRHFGAIMYYIFDPRWSKQAVFNQRGHPERSGGSWLLSGGLNLLHMSNDGPLLEDLDPPLEGGRFYIASIAPGYGYTLVRDPWYISPVFLLGAGMMYADHSVPNDPDASDSDWYPIVKVGLKVASGYAGDTWRFGLDISLDSPAYRFNDFHIQWYAGKVEFYVGRYF